MKVSDLDIVVVPDAALAPYRETLRYQGWPVELFAHTIDSLDVWWRDRPDGPTQGSSPVPLAPGRSGTNANGRVATSAGQTRV
jgi:hypothetical protein